MAQMVMKNAKILVNGADLTGYTNTVAINSRQEVLDMTCFGSSARRRKPGLFDFSLNVGGFWDSSGGVTGSTARKPDVVANSAVGSSGIVSIIPEGTAPGNIAYFGEVYGSEYSRGGAVGDMMSYSLVCVGNGKLIRGKVLQSGSITTNLTEAEQQLEHTSTANLRRLYGCAHVLTCTGKTDFTILGSSASDFGTQSTLLKWVAVTSSTKPGKARFASTKISSTKITFFKARITTGCNFNGEILVGVAKN